MATRFTKYHKRQKGKRRAGEVEKYGEYEITVNPESTLMELIALGQYDYIFSEVYDMEMPDEEATEEYKVTLEMLVFTRSESNNMTIKRFKKLGYRPATFRELMTFGVQHPDVQLDVLITSLGAIENYGDTDWYPCLYCWLDERVVYHSEGDGEYRGRCFFAFVKEN